MHPDAGFQSFFMGGFECSTHRLPTGRRLDVIRGTAHDRFALEDYERLASVGIRTARDGLRWHLIEERAGRYDFSSAVPMLAAARRAGVQVIWDLFHYGWPDGLDIFSETFIERFEGFARAFARVASEETEGFPWIVPINEISFFSWAAGHMGIFNPFVRGHSDELKVHLVRAAIAAIRGMRAEHPDIQIVHTEPMINVVARTDRPQDRGPAEAHRLAQYTALDMIAGRVHPELGGREQYLGTLGVNYYIHNQWVYPGGPGCMIEPTHPRYRPVWQMLQEFSRHFNRPVFIAETGIEDEARPAWLRYMGYEVRRALRASVPVRGLCLYPIVNHPGWDDDRHCYNGLWDYADEHGERQIYEPLARELLEQQRLLEEQEQAGQLVSGPEADTHLLDVAAHWMEIRTGREQELQKS